MFCSVAKTGVTRVVVVKRLEVVQEASGNAHSFKGDGDANAGKGRAEVKEYEERSDLVGDRVCSGS